MTQRKKIAAIITTFYPASHADVIVTKFVEGFPTDAVAATPVGICVLDLVSVTLPTEAVVERPVRVYAVSKVKEPRDDVIDCPVKV